jgi:hypothetical protein
MKAEPRPKLDSAPLSVTTEGAQAYTPKASTGSQRASGTERPKAIAIRIALPMKFHPMAERVRLARLCLPLNAYAPDEYGPTSLSMNF